jgi:acyl-CoA hydrolase
MPLVAYPDGVDSARLAPSTVADLVDEPSPEVLLGWTPEHRPWLSDDALRGTTTMAGYALDGAVRAGRIRYLPIRLSAVPTLVRRLRPDVAVVAGIRRGSDLAFLGTVGWGPAATAAANAVVVEVDDGAPDLGTPAIPGRIVAAVPRAAMPTPPTPRVPDEIDLEIGRRVAALVPDDATIQLGPGGIAAAIVAGLERPVGIWSGLLTDAMASLADRDLLRGTVTAGYVWGGRPIVELHRAGRLRLAPVEETHDVARVAEIPRFVACNTALEVGLDGAVNVERVGDRIVSGIGGHADYSAAASISDGGLSIVALRSTDRRGRSTIVPRVDVVSTPRSDIGLVVTEHGIADLRDADDAQRAERLTAIAAPEHRAALGAGQP